MQFGLFYIQFYALVDLSMPIAYCNQIIYIQN